MTHQSWYAKCSLRRLSTHRIPRKAFKDWLIRRSARITPSTRSSRLVRPHPHTSRPIQCCCRTTSTLLICRVLKTRSRPNAWFALLADDGPGKGVHAGRPQGKAHDEIHSGGADDAVVNQRVLGHERDPGEPRCREPHVREMTPVPVVYIIVRPTCIPLGNCTLGPICTARWRPERRATVGIYNVISCHFFSRV